MNIKLISPENIHDNLGKTNLLIKLSDLPAPNSFLIKPKQLPDKNPVLSYSFKDASPSLATLGTVEEDMKGLCDINQVQDVINTIKSMPSNSTVYLYDTQGITPRLLAYYIGISCMSKPISDSLYNCIQISSSVVPNLWVISLFEYLLEDKPIYSALLEMIATNVIVSSQGQIRLTHYNMG